MTQRPFTRAWIYAKPTVEARRLKELENVLCELGFQAAVHPAYPAPTGLPRMEPTLAVEWADFALVVGGDGTLLRAFHETRGALPLLGVNSGDSVGYLMDVTLESAVPALQLIARGTCTIESRLVGEASVGAWGSLFVNEVAALTLRCGTLFRAKVFVDDELVAEGRLDGLIIATPTGSTAYALSAGGPIVDPSLSAFTIVPLAPFSALLKPYVASADRKLAIAIDGGCSVVVDGTITGNFNRCEITVRKAATDLKLIKTLPGENLRSKLLRRLLDLTPTQFEAIGLSSR